MQAGPNGLAGEPGVVEQDFGVCDRVVEVLHVARERRRKTAARLTHKHQQTTLEAAARRVHHGKVAEALDGLLQLGVVLQAGVRMRLDRERLHAHLWVLMSGRGRAV